MPQEKCYICGSTASISPSNDNLTHSVDCSRCKKYKIAKETVNHILDRLVLSEQQIANLSYWIYHNQNPIIDENNILHLSTLPTPTVGEKARRFLTFILEKHPRPGEFIKGIEANDAFYLTLTGCYDKTEFGYIVKDYLFETKKFLLNYDDSSHRYSFKISPEGWAYIESLKNINPESQIGFIAMWFNKKLDPFLQVVEEAILDAGYHPIRLDRKEHNNNIDDEIIATIRQSKFVVADFTGQRGGVYFEAGYAKGIGLEVIHLCKQPELKKVHFDNRQSNFIVWTEKGFDDLKKDLTNRIIATIGRGTYKPPAQ